MGMRKVFVALATLLMAAVIVQFFMAGSGAFDTAAKDEAFQPHRAIGYGILLLAVLLTVFAAIIRMPVRIVGMAGLAAGLALLQPVIRAVAGALGAGDTSTLAGELIFGLHAVNGLIIFGAAEAIQRRAREFAAAAPGSGADASRNAEASGPLANPAHPAP
jgi:hypothetical protein